MPGWIHACVLGGFAMMFWICARTYDHNTPIATVMTLITGFMFGYMMLW